jgi:hypothetical protein
MRILVVAFLIASELLLGGCSSDILNEPNAVGDAKRGGGQKMAEDYFKHRKDLLVFSKYVGGSGRLPQPPEIIENDFPSQEPTNHLPSGDYRLQVAYVVETDGSVREVAIVSSSGVKLIDNVFLEKTKKRRYFPAELDGQKYPVALMEIIKFKNIVKP